MHSIQSIDGRVTDIVDTDTGQLSTLLPNGHRLIRTALDTQRLLRLLVDCQEVIGREADREAQRLGEGDRSQIFPSSL